MYTEAERAKIASYIDIEKRLRGTFTQSTIAHHCELPGCVLARLVLRRCEIERDALRRSLSELQRESKETGNII